MKPVFLPNLFALFLWIFSVTIACIHLVRPSLANDRLSWLLTYISFVVDHRWTFRSIIDIAIDSVHIGRRIFSVNHSSALCLQPRIHRDPTHARHATLCRGTRGISRHQNTGEIRRNCTAEYGIVAWRTIYSNAKYYSFRSILLGRPAYFLWTVPLCIYRLHKSIGQKMTQPAALGASWTHHGCDWPHVAR